MTNEDIAKSIGKSLGLRGKDLAMWVYGEMGVTYE